MPKYTLKCGCGNKSNFDVPISKVSELDNIVCGTCKNLMSRDFGGINMRDSNNASDPKSSKHWKVGKSDEEISKVLTGEAKP